MELDDVIQGVLWVIASIALGTLSVLVYWRLRSVFALWRAPKRRLQSARSVIWRDPGDVGRLDLRAGPGGRDGAPQPPFAFIREESGGSQPCISVRDRGGRTWRVKWGNEVQSETLATRLVWAAGYFVETTYFVAEGRIDGAHGLRRASACLDDKGSFERARFELNEAHVIKHFDAQSWAWNDNPFLGTPELSGLKVVMMWLSNWDAKDVRDVALGSNTAVFEHRTTEGREARYLITDWGATFGQWGTLLRRSRWDCAAFRADTDRWIVGVEGDVIRFGYTGQRTADIAEGIRVSDVEWVLRTLGQLSDQQIGDAVAASGGTAEDVACFTPALRARLDLLHTVLSPGAERSSSPASAAP